MKITVQSLAALSVISPSVEVAWCDGELDDRERKAILQAASDAGISVDGPGYKLLQEWLKAKPPATMLSAWKDYIEAMAETLTPDDFNRVRDNLLTRSASRRRAAGGIWDWAKSRPPSRKSSTNSRRHFRAQK